ETLSLTGGIDGSSGADLHKAGAGTLVLGNYNIIGGQTYIDGGILRLDKTYSNDSNLINWGRGVTVAGGTTFDVNGRHDTIGSLAGAGNVALGAGGELDTGNNSTSTTFSGVISGIGNAYAALVKEGTGTFLLTGANTYENETKVMAGTLRVD